MEKIRISRGFLQRALGEIPDLYHIDHGDVLPVGSPLPSEYLKGYQWLADIGSLEVLYLGIQFILASENNNAGEFSMSEVEYSDAEMRHLLRELKASWFPLPQPELDALLPFVSIISVNQTLNQWIENDLPKLRAGLPKLLT
ncbi:MAG: hypothetical protein U0176_04960 [Bacteroidia bacterium]